MKRVRGAGTDVGVGLVWGCTCAGKVPAEALSAADASGLPPPELPGHLQSRKEKQCLSHETQGKDGVFRSTDRDAVERAGSVRKADELRTADLRCSADENGRLAAELHTALCGASESVRPRSAAVAAAIASRVFCSSDGEMMRAI